MILVSIASFEKRVGGHQLNYMEMQLTSCSTRRAVLPSHPVDRSCLIKLHVGQPRPPTRWPVNPQRQKIASEFAIGVSDVTAQR